MANYLSYLSSSATRPRTRKVDTSVDTYEMANLSTATTGLPLTIWVSPRGLARHDARIKVSLTRGKMDVNNIAVVSIRPEPKALTGGIGTEDFGKIASWITINREALLDYWDEVIDTGQLIGRLRKV